MNQTTILIADDNVELATLIAEFLQSEGHIVEMVHNGAEALQMLLEHHFDLLILDLDLPVLKGPEVLERLRARQKEIPVLVLTGMEQIEERIQCLDGGADDYVTKPVALAELAARVRALLRRVSRNEDSVLRVGDLELDRLQRRVTRAGKSIALTTKEFSLLEYFMHNCGRPITRSVLIEDVWGMSNDMVTNVVDVYVNYLRRKIDNGAGPKLINTVRGVGFCFGTAIPGSGDEQTT